LKENYKKMSNVDAVEKVADLHPVEAVKGLQPVAKTVTKVRKISNLVPNRISNKVGRSVLKLRKHSPSLLFAAGVVGFGVTVVLASRATMRSEDVINHHEIRLDRAKSLLAEEREDYVVHDYNRDMFVLYTQTTIEFAKLYGPAIIVGALSIAAFGKAQHILNKRNAALFAAYAATRDALDKYRARVREELGEDMDAKFMYDGQPATIVEDTDKGPKKVPVIVPGPDGASMYAKYFDKSNRNWEPTMSINRLFVKCQQNTANDILQSRGHIFLNEVYTSLGMEHTQEGAIVGWVKGMGDNYVDFGIFAGPDTHKVHDFVNSYDGFLLLDFNVDGPIWNLI